MSPLRWLQTQEWVGVYAAQSVMVAFYLSLDLTLADFSLAQAVFVGTIFLFGIPAGWLVDNYDRPYCLWAGNALTAIGFGWYVSAHSLADVLLGEVILGAGAALISGATDSLLATYARAGEHAIGKAYSHTTAISLLTAGVLVALGGWIGSEKQAYAIALSALLYAVAAGIAILLPELRSDQTNTFLGGKTLQQPLKDMWQSIVTTLYLNKRLRWAILAACAGIQMIRALLWVQSALYEQAGIPAPLIGVAWFVWLGAGALGAWIVGKVIDSWSVYRLFLSSVGCLFAAMAVLGTHVSAWTIGLFLVIGFFGGWNTSLFRAFIQREGGDETLASTKSVAQNVNIVFYVAATFVVGWIATELSVQATLWTNIALFLPLVVLCAYKLRALP